MPKDTRYKTVKILIEAGHITSFAQIFEHIPPSVVSKEFGSNYTRFTRMINNPSDLKLRELFTLAGMFGVSDKVMVDLAVNQNKGKRK